MAVVYRATQPDLERPVAVKVIASRYAGDRKFRARFTREARLAAAIEHPNVLPVYEAGEHQGELYLAMRWVEGSDLERLIHSAGPLEPTLAARLLAQIAEALEAAHAKGLTHRDVKPANVLIAGGSADETGDGVPHAYLSDFGVARHVDSTAGLTDTKGWIGTPEYSAPEQIEGEPVGAATDAYALGCVAYAAFAGRPPFTRDQPLETAWAHVHEEPPGLCDMRPDIPVALEDAVSAALTKRPDLRPTPRELTEAIVDAVQDNGRSPESDAPAVPPTAVAGPRRTGARTAGLESERPTHRIQTGARRRLKVTLAAAAAIAALALGGVAALVATGTVTLFDDAPRTESPAATAGADADPAPDATGPSAQAEPPTEATPPSGRDEGSLSLSVPDVVGAPLDVAEERLDLEGVAYEVFGGGVFGVVVASNWAVCDSDPNPGEPLGSAEVVAVFVDRSC